MLAGQVGVVTENPGWYGRAVQFFTHSKAFHTVTAISDTECVSATVPVVEIVPIDRFSGVIWTQVPMTPSQVRDSVNYVRRQVGKPYAYLDIFFLLIASVTKHRTPMWIIHRLISTRQWFCSELGDAGMLAAGVNLFPGRPACAVTPADFYRSVTKR